MTLLADLEVFVHDHQPHGSMTADATKPASNGYRLTVACVCGVVFERWVTLRMRSTISTCGRSAASARQKDWARRAARAVLSVVANDAAVSV